MQLFISKQLAIVNTLLQVNPLTALTCNSISCLGLLTSTSIIILTPGLTVTIYAYTYIISSLCFGKRNYLSTHIIITIYQFQRPLWIGNRFSFRNIHPKSNGLSSLRLQDLPCRNARGDCIIVDPVVRGSVWSCSTL